MKHEERCSAIERLKEYRPEIARAKRGLPDTGRRMNGDAFCSELRRIDDAFRLGNEVYSREWDISTELLPFNSGNGSPMLQHPFPPAARAATAILQDQQISQYVYASGDAACREKVADYLSSIGIVTDAEDKRVHPGNVIFFNSTTEAFSMVLKLICRPGDVVLFTSPTYGLFAYEPERLGAVSRFIRLRAEDGWLVNTQELDRLIAAINQSLAQETALPYTPRVVAFVNLNPNNPTGLSMGRSERARLEGIHSVCQKQGVFLIDDIIYRDLCFDMDEPAMPVAAVEDAFSNTITLFGTSKSYGLAGARAGGVAADETVIRGLRNEIFRHMDSTPLQVSYMMAGAFNTDPERHEAYQIYFSEILRLYRENWQITKALVQGCGGDGAAMPDDVLSDIADEFVGETDAVLRHGIPLLSIAGGIEPQSGFFALVDLTALLGKRHADAEQPLETEMDILYYFYRYANVKLLTGSSFAWPAENGVAARVSFSYHRKDLIKMFRQIYDAVKRLY